MFCISFAHLKRPSDARSCRLSPCILGATASLMWCGSQTEWREKWKGSDRFSTDALFITKRSDARWASSDLEGCLQAQGPDKPVVASTSYWHLEKRRGWHQLCNERLCAQQPLESCGDPRALEQEAFLTQAAATGKASCRWNQGTFASASNAWDGSGGNRGFRMLQTGCHTLTYFSPSIQPHILDARVRLAVSGGWLRPQFSQFCVVIHRPMGTGLSIRSTKTCTLRLKTQEFAFQLLLAPNFSFRALRLDLEVQDDASTWQHHFAN